ncbi:SipW-dependent-type signal peptide-containing protein [Gordonia malaquae]|uniref:SipW-dependent-type signal peptide-containing protein n=1 Tax=Gordonia malaquae TaxID=410332 RepID=UPI0030C79417
MSSPTQSRLRGRLGETGWTRARAIASLGMVFGLGAVGTMAAWSDTATATTGMFTTSSINIQMKVNDNRPIYNFTSLKKINMARGATTSGVLEVKNTGSHPFTYVMSVDTANNGTATYGSASAAVFAQNLLVTVSKGGTKSGDTCTGGTTLGTADKPLVLGSTALVPTTGPLAVNASDNLCVQVKVNPNAPKEARMAAISAKFKLTATKV